MKFTLTGFHCYKGQDGQERVNIHGTTDTPLSNGTAVLSTVIIKDPFIKYEVGKTYETVERSSFFQGKITSYVVGLK